MKTDAFSDAGTLPESPSFQRKLAISLAFPARLDKPQAQCLNRTLENLQDSAQTAEVGGVKGRAVKMSSKKRETKAKTPNRPKIATSVWIFAVLVAASGIILWRARHQTSDARVGGAGLPGASSFLSTIENKTT